MFNALALMHRNISVLTLTSIVYPIDYGSIKFLLLPKVSYLSVR